MMLNNQAQGNGFYAFKPAITAGINIQQLLLMLTPVALGISISIAIWGLVAAAVWLIIIIGLPLAYGIVAYPRFGIAVFVIVAFLLNYITQLLPRGTSTGIVLDGISYLLIFGLFVKLKYERKWSYFKNPVSYLVLIWLAYNLLEAVNPLSPAILAWLYTVRTVGFIMLTYFVFIYQIRSLAYIRFLLKLWLFLCVLAAISAFQQENIGLLPFERIAYFSDPLRIRFLLINGHLRTVALFPDPVTFSYNMAVASVICICLLLSVTKIYKKVILLLLVSFFLLTMLYSGTRSAFLLLPAAMALFAVMRFNKQILIFALAGGICLAGLVFMPTSNHLVKRFQSAFNPSHDASYNVRTQNLRRIKPYINSHPFGGGLGSVGVWGRRFAPNSYLAKFPPDSGYVRVAVEMGYVGLVLFCTLIFVMLYNGINCYYLIKNHELKIYCLAMVLVVFILNVGNYPQQALIQYPSNVLFYLAAALVSVCLRLDKEKKQQKPLTALPGL